MADLVRQARLAVDTETLETIDLTSGGRSTPRSLSDPISPPRKRSRHSIVKKDVELTGRDQQGNALQTQVFDSPFQLTRIRDLHNDSNVDTLTLKDLLGDPLISECWEFNFLHDLDFLMSAFDADVKRLVKVHVVHGFWKREDASRMELEVSKHLLDRSPVTDRNLQAQAARYNNVTLHTAFMPEMFGTHHTKMMILLRHDDTAQVIIYTANMIARDWKNMSQAVWRSPMLPLQIQGAVVPGSQEVGRGQKFKIDFLNYLKAYDGRRVICRPIIERLDKYDFSSIKGALIGSIPGRHNIYDDSPTRWGWSAMRHALQAVPIHEKSDIVVQVSSIATLGPTDKWLRDIFLDSLSQGKGSAGQPDFKIIFPTADEIRKSLDGYVSGHSIHTKIQSAQQVKQLQYLMPMFCHWANDSEEGDKLQEKVAVMEAGRKRAAPHIKTYIRYGNKSEKTIDWALITSANLSKQAWGEAATKNGEIRISSYELGVLVWPDLFAEGARMTATFKSDKASSAEVGQGGAVVGLRLAYNLPLQPYGPGERPWVASMSHTEEDWKGETWP